MSACGRAGRSARRRTPLALRRARDGAFDLAAREAGVSLAACSRPARPAHRGRRERAPRERRARRTWPTRQRRAAARGLPHLQAEGRRGAARARPRARRARCAPRSATLPSCGSTRTARGASANPSRALAALAPSRRSTSRSPSPGLAACARLRAPRACRSRPTSPRADSARSSARCSLGAADVLVLKLPRSAVRAPLAPPRCARATPASTS